MDREKLFSQPYAWEALKRNLKAGHIAIENLLNRPAWSPRSSLAPQPIPLQVRVAIVGSPRLFHLAQQVDADFASMFKVAADFSDTMSRSTESDELFARLIAAMVREDKAHAPSTSTAWPA